MDFSPESGHLYLTMFPVRKWEHVIRSCMHRCTASFYPLISETRSTFTIYHNDIMIVLLSYITDSYRLTGIEEAGAIGTGICNTRQWHWGGSWYRFWGKFKWSSYWRGCWCHGLCKPSQETTHSQWKALEIDTYYIMSTSVLATCDEYVYFVSIASSWKKEYSNFPWWVGITFVIYENSTTRIIKLLRKEQEQYKFCLLQW